MAEITREELFTRYRAGERDFSGLDFRGLDLSRIRDEEMLSQVDWPPYATLRENYPLNRCIFRGANFSFVNFSRTTLNFSDFRDAILFRADFSYASFIGSNFTRADMREVTFEWGEGIGVIFENVDFRGCDTIGKFVTEGTLYIRNCIGRKGEIINLFGQHIVIKEIDRESVDEWNDVPIKWNCMPIDRIPRIGLTATQPNDTQTIDEDSIPF